jgi:hypothetical protein
MMNFDMTLGKSTTPVVLDIVFQSVERVSGQKPYLRRRVGVWTEKYARLTAPKAPMG